MEFMENFEKVVQMVMEATVLHEKSLNALCVEDDYDRYTLTADWCGGKPTLYITHDNVHGERSIWYEVKQINRTEIVRLLDEWQLIVALFGEEE